LTANANNHIVNVTGTCGGTLTGNSFTTNAISADCTVVANFAIDTFTVTPRVTGSGSIAPNTPQTVNFGSTATFTLTANANNHIVDVTGTCGGTLTGNSFTTNAISGNCTVIANFAIDTFTVTPSVTGSGSIAPNTPQTVNFGSTATFTLTPTVANHLVSVTGSCGGTLTGNSFTTNAVSTNCTVIGNFAPNPATQLVFVQQPTDGTAGVALSPAITLEARDAFGNVVITDSNNVTVTVNGPGPFDPASTTTVALSSGVATFSNLAFDVAGSGYTLTGHDVGDGLTSAPSTAFSIVAAGASQIVFTTQPANVLRGEKLGTVAVTEEDAFGNPIITDSTSSVDFSIAACGGTVDLGSATLSNGVGTLTGSSQHFYTFASGLTVDAASGSFTASSNGFNVVANAGYIFSDGFESCRL
jgi:hypothetical protein